MSPILDESARNADFSQEESAMKKSIKIALIGVSVVAIGATVACASHHAHHPHHGERAQRYVSHRVDRVLSEIDATESQRAEIHRVKDHLFHEFESAHAGSRAAKHQLLKEWKSKAPNRERLHALADERVAAYQKAVHEMIDGVIDVHATLKPEQRAEITEHIEERMKD
jgi:Spy/CpxP family protein refolding chaperone